MVEVKGMGWKRRSDRKGEVELLGKGRLEKRWREERTRDRIQGKTRRK